MGGAVVSTSVFIFEPGDHRIAAHKPISFDPLGTWRFCELSLLKEAAGALDKKIENEICLFITNLLPDTRDSFVFWD